MKVILIILLIIFLLIISLFSITIISRNKSTASEEADSLTTEESNKDSKTTVSDSMVTTIDDVQETYGDDFGNISSGIKENEIEEGSNTTGSTDNNQEETLQVNDEESSQTQLQDNEGNDSGETPAEEEEEIKNGTIKFFLDGDMENGIYLGETLYSMESAEAFQLYGEDFKDTGFKFTCKNDDSLNLLAGSTHYIYIYFYGAKSGWDYIREEIDLSGEEVREKNIIIFIDEPKEKTITSSLQLIRGWAVDLRNKENSGIKDIEIYLNGPRGYGKLLGSAQYSIPRQGVADFFKNQNYLNSGYQFEKLVKLEPGSIHTIFIYAISSKDGLFNYEVREIYLSGTKEEKAIISAQINMQKLNQDSIIEITGWAIDKNVLEEKQELEKETSGSEDGYSVKKIVYVSNRDGNENIYSINIDGTELTRLTDYSGNDLYPEASPDGKKIAYTSDIGGVWQIMVMDWDGKNKRQITNNNFRSAYPSWSYDSNYIYFEAYFDGDWELFRIKSDGTEQKRLTFNSNSYDWHPNGHPYKYEIIYESGITGHENIYVMDHNGSGKRNIASDGPRRRVPDVSSDGSKITYMRYSGDNSEIWIMDYNGQNETRLTDNPDWDGHPSFSPDGKYIVYEERKGSVENLILIDLASGGKINITNSHYIDKDASFLYQKQVTSSF
ncbi:MAG: TolB family protein [Actinobacteria bacterium]|nr:TolB family protein [Actinomycetota bacterium]